MSAIDLAMLLAALAIGVALGLLVLRPRLAAAEAEAEAQRQRTAALEGELAELRPRLEAETRRAEGLAATLEAERRAHEEKIAELRAMGEEIERKFQALAREALKGANESFLELATQHFEKHKVEAGAELEQRRQAIEALVKPVAESLARFETRVGEIEKAREGAYRAVLEQVNQLREGQRLLHSETSRLVTALRAPKTRGRWGEMQLRRVFEMAGMMEHVDFETEHHIGGADGARRPDAVVTLPGDKIIVIDAKTPLEAYLNAVEAQDDEGRRAAMRAHVEQVRAQVRDLSRKEYWSRVQQAVGQTPDFVVMFIPLEAAYASAVEIDPGLFEKAFEQRVLIATPTTLVALVKAIAYGWQQQKLTESAQQIAGLARELYERVRVFGGHVERLGRALNTAVGRYNDAVGSLEGRVLPTARRIESLGVVPAGKAIDPPSPVESEPRPVTAAELRREGGDEDDAPDALPPA